MKSRKIQSSWLLFLLIPILCAGQTVWAAGPPPARVVLGKVVQQEVAQNRSVIGVLYYERTSDISTEVAGLVDNVKVDQGDRVKQGDTLVELNTEILDQEISLTKTRISQAQLRIDNTLKNFKRLEKLYKEAGVSEKDFDDAEYAFQDAQMEKKASQDTLKKLMIQKKRSIITAPYGGIILTKDVDSGGWVQQGKQLVSLGSSEDLYVRAPIAENLLQYIEIGGKVPVTVTAFGNETEGTVIDIDPVADVKTKNIFLKIKIAPLPLVAQNMSATVHVPSSSKQQLKVLPRAAIVKFKGSDFVYTVKDGKAAILPVNIVTFMGESVAVDNPYIVPGMGVVIEGNERLRPDQAVTVAGE
ncbi:efflux RND transporter periplasmic adaptor subunit [Desulfosediminicola flagellatus]|uniref:efflux RND transporter periplasmic adaptor subunit n=1 Tax=Desulfosediminicola flagellatus TaxID=2569541 RepID=UPI0010AC55FC|nr:efflux RND transporter periplasmic adaptor subunit [Desulfosediminicola flagellatus]